MKNTILKTVILFVICIATISSCKNVKEKINQSGENIENVSEDALKKVKEVGTEVKKVAEKLATEIPDFKSKTAKTYVKQIEKFYADLKTAAEKEDHNAYETLQEKGQELLNKYEVIISELKPEAQELMDKYLTEKSELYEELISKFQ